MKVLITDSAFNDLKNVTAWYLEQGVPHIGQQFVVAIIEHIQTLTDHPDIGRAVPEFDQANIREIIHPPFRIVYLREANTAKVIRVWRSERLLSLPKNET